MSDKARWGVVFGIFIWLGVLGYWNSWDNNITERCKAISATQMEPGAKAIVLKEVCLGK